MVMPQEQGVSLPLSVSIIVVSAELEKLVWSTRGGAGYGKYATFLAHPWRLHSVS